MIRKATLAALVVSSLATASTNASAQPGIANLAHATPAANEMSDIANVGWRRGRFGLRVRKHLWRRSFVHVAPNCYRYLKLYKVTGNPRWKRKFYWCKHY